MSKALLQKCKDQAAFENGWVDWICFRSDSDWMDQDPIIDRAIELYGQAVSTLEARKVEFENKT